MSDSETRPVVWRRVWNRLTRVPEWRFATSDDRARLDRTIVGLASVGAVAAFAFAPLQNFVDRELLFLGAMFIVMGLIPAVVLPQRDVPRAALWLTIVPIIVGAVVLFAAGNSAVTASKWNDRRCGRIQSAMLQPPKGARSDLVDLFTAMGCRPSGVAPVDPSYRVSKDDPPTAEQEAKHRQFLNEAVQAEVQIVAPSLD